MGKMAELEGGSRSEIGVSEYHVIWSHSSLIQTRAGSATLSADLELQAKLPQR